MPLPGWTICSEPQLYLEVTVTHSETPTESALIPRFLLAGLEAGTLDLTGWVLWAVLRFYAPDQKPGTFSPPPVAVTNRELAHMTRLSRRHVINVLNALEAGGWLHRLTQEEKAAAGLRGPRWLRLTRPGPVKSTAGLEATTVQSSSGASNAQGVQSDAVQPTSIPGGVRVLTDADRYLGSRDDDVDR